MELPLQNKRFNNLDIAKFVCALLVIVIHTAPLENVSKMAYFYTSHVMARIAVPIFFSISGFLFFRKLEWKDDKIEISAKNFSLLIDYLKKIILLYVIWTLLYVIVSLPGWYEAGWWGPYVVKDVIVSLLVRGSYYHLWYLLACIYAVPLLFLTLMIIKKRSFVWVTAVLWILECLTYSYSWLGIENIEIVSLIAQKCPIVFDATLRAVPLLMVGCLAIDEKALQSMKKQCLITVGMFAVCVIEASVLHALLQDTGKYSYLISTPLFAYAEIRLLTAGTQMKISETTASILRKASLTIYCLHPFIINTCKALKVADGVPIWFLTTVSTMSIALLLAWVKKRYVKKTEI